LPVGYLHAAGIPTGSLTVLLHDVHCLMSTA